MTKYIRTNYEIITYDEYITRVALGTKTLEMLDQSDKIEDLIRDGDMLYIKDLYPDTVLVVERYIKPFGYNDKISLKEWLDYDHIEFELYIKQSNGDYRKVAERYKYKKLELIKKGDNNE